VFNKYFLFSTGGAGGGGGGGGRPFSDPSQPWRFPLNPNNPNFPLNPNLPNNGRRRRSLDNICGELRRQFTQSNSLDGAQNVDNLGSARGNPSQLSSLLESLKNFPLPSSNALGSDLRNLPNLNSNSLQTPNFPGSESVKSFENLNNDPLSPTFAGSNNVNGDNAFFGGGNNLENVNTDLGNGFGAPDNLGNDKSSSNENALDSNALANGLDTTKGNGFNQFKDNIDQKDGPMSNPLLSNFYGDMKSSQFDQSRLYGSDDDLWNFGQYDDSTSNDDFPTSYYDNGDASNSWMMEDYNGYRRLVIETSGYSRYFTAFSIITWVSRYFYILVNIVNKIYCGIQLTRDSKIRNIY
jgi:hypothetical protein